MRLATIMLPILLLSAALPALADPAGIVVVRHAEKADDGTRDPNLDSAGQARAEALADTLEQAEVAGLIASQYRRTRQTLAVLAERHGLQVAIAPAHSGAIDDHIDEIVSMVRAYDTRGLVVIAGHSNTVPLIVEALAGRAVAPIDESEYDRLYLLLPSASGANIVSTRYGKINR